MNDHQQPSTPSLRALALNRLARREHSREELRRALAESLDAEAAKMDAVLDRLETEGLLSDARFAEAFTAARIRRGQGSVRIRNELRERGIADELIQATFSAMAVDWAELARKIARQRFGTSAPTRGAALAKQMRFLRYRGFTGEEINFALRHNED